MAMFYKINLHRSRRERLKKFALVNKYENVFSIAALNTQRRVIEMASSAAALGLESLSKAKRTDGEDETE